VKASMSWSVFASAVFASSALAQLGPGQTLFSVYQKCVDPVPEYRIQACSDLILSGELPARSLVAVYLYRGNAYQVLGQDDAARRDFDHVILLDSHQAGAFANRGLSYAAQGGYDRAIQDYDQAIRIDPHYAWAFESRGITRFVQGDFAGAVPDFVSGMNADADARPYGALWLYLANARLGNVNDSILVRASKKLKSGIWPEPVLAMLLGQISDSAVIAARNTGSDATKRGQPCEAALYVGEHKLLEGLKDEAAKFFADAAVTCPHTFFEYPAAVGELRHAPP
jgi:lipoprotein NlpI